MCRLFIVPCMLLSMVTMASAVEHQTVYLEVVWSNPITHPDWQPWMEGKTITVKTSVATANGQYDYYNQATIGAKSLHVSMVMDVTGLEPGYQYIIAAEVPGQWIHNNFQEFTHVSAPLQFWFCEDGVNPLSQQRNIGTLKLFNE